MEFFLNVLPIILLFIFIPLVYYFLKWYCNLVGKALYELIHKK